MSGVGLPIRVYPFVDSMHDAMPQTVQVRIHVRLRGTRRAETERILIGFRLRQGLGLC